MANLNVFDGDITVKCCDITLEYVAYNPIPDREHNDLEAELHRHYRVRLDSYLGGLRELTFRYSLRDMARMMRKYGVPDLNVKCGECGKFTEIFYEKLQELGGRRITLDEQEEGWEEHWPNRGLPDDIELPEYINDKAMEINPLLELSDPEPDD